MNSTASDQVQQIFDSLHPFIAASLSPTYTHDILIIIGFLTIGILVSLMVIQFCLKVRQIYRTSEPYKSCLPFCRSCLPQSQCMQSNQSVIYEQINEKLVANN